MDELEAAGIDDIIGFVYYETYRFVISKRGFYHFWANKKVFLILSPTVDMCNYNGISPEMIGIRKNTNKHIYVTTPCEPLEQNRNLEFVLIDRDNPSDYTNIKTDIVLKPNWQHHLIKGDPLLDSDKDREYKLILYDNKKIILVYNLNKTELIEFDKEIIIPDDDVYGRICSPYIFIEHNISGNKKFRNIDDF